MAKDKDKKKKKKQKVGSDKTKGFKLLDGERHKYRLENVRIAFPNLFSPMARKPEDTPKFSAAFLMDEKEHAATIEALQECVDTLAKENGMKKLKTSLSCLKPGEEKDEYEGFEGTYFISASNTRRPMVLDTDKTPLAEADGKIYPGCYVDAIVEIWKQDNIHGKRINAQLSGIRFVADGEPLGGGSIADEEDFD